MGTNASRFLRLTLPPMAGPDIAILQTRLRERGVYQGPVNGRYEAETERAVRAFQQAQSLPITGIVDNTTWTTLGLGALPDPRSPTAAFISIDTTRRNLSFYRGERLEKSYDIAVGKNSTPTPLGDWIITQKATDPGGPFGARWMRLSIPWGGYPIYSNTKTSCSMITAKRRNWQELCE